MANVNDKKARLTYAPATIGELSALLAEYPSLKGTIALKTTLKAAIATLIQAIQSANVAETNPAVWTAALETLKDDQSDAIEAGIHTIEEYQAAILATITDATICPQCAGNYKVYTGRDEEFGDGGTTVYVKCPTCLSQGKTSGQYQATIPEGIIPTYTAV